MVISKICKLTLLMMILLLLLTGCLHGTPTEVEATETITPAVILTETTISTATSTEVTEPTVTPTETATLTSRPTETAKLTDTPSPRELLPLPDPLFAIAYIFKDTLRIKCVEIECFREIYLGDAAPFERPYKLWSVHYLNPASMYITIFTPWTLKSEALWTVLHINPETREAKPVNIPSDYRIIVQDIAYGRLVLVQEGLERVLIIQEDLSVIEVELGVEVFQLIEAEDHKMIAVNDQPIEKEERTYIETFIIDVRSGEFTRELVSSPAFLQWYNLPVGKSTEDTLAALLLTVSADLKYVYLYYRAEGDVYLNYLGMFDTTSLDEEISVIDPEFLWVAHDPRLYSRQYHNVSYPRYVGGGAESMPTGLFTPVELSTLEPLIDPVGASITVPFGDHFAIGTKNRVFLVSLDGKNITEYPLPYNGGLTYRLVEYNK